MKPNQLKFISKLAKACFPFLQDKNLYKLENVYTKDSNLESTEIVRLNGKRLIEGKEYLLDKETGLITLIETGDIYYQVFKPKIDKGIIDYRKINLN